MKRKIYYILLAAALVFFSAALIIYPERYVNCCFQGIAMWAECVLPSLFPFMVITLIFVKTGIAEKASLPLKRATNALKFPSATSTLFILSILSGYPAGSRVVKEYCDGGIISKSDCPKTAYLCSTSGPLFIIGSVGFKMFGDKLAGVKILIAHIFAVTLVSVIISLFSKKGTKTSLKRTPSQENILYECFYGGVIAVCVAGGFIAFFFTAATFAADFSLLYPLERFLNLFIDGQTSKAVTLGLIEATTGCKALAGSSLKIPLAGFLITFGGLSILLQQLCYLVKAGVKPLKFISVKFIQGILCFLVLLLIA